MSEVKRTVKQDGKCLLDVIEKHGLAEHGAEISVSLVRETIGLVMPALGTKAQFDATIGIHPTAAEEFVTMREPASPA